MNPNEVAALVVEMGLIPAGVSAEFEALTGGVSSDIWLVKTAQTQFVVKRALEELKVAAHWSAPVDRGASEAAWLIYVGQAVPGAAPKVLAFDQDTMSLALEFLDADEFANWKTQLLSGEVNSAVAADVGKVLGQIHSASANEPDLAAKFANQHLFEDLRIEPYFERTAAALPALSGPLSAVIALLRAPGKALVHGDFSPKNILVGSRVVVLDAECATWSDPAFDAAFALSHLALKMVHLPEHATSLRAAAHAFEDAYLAQVDWENSVELESRINQIIPALMLARVAGASPAEYLTAAEQDWVQAIATQALVAGQPIWDLMTELQGETDERKD